MPENHETQLALKRDLLAKGRRLFDIVETASLEGRDLSRRERAQVAEIARETEQLRVRVPQARGEMTQGPYTTATVDTTAPNVLRPKDSYADYLREHQPSAFRDHGLWDELLDPSRFSLGRMARGMASGNWRGAEMERRAMLEGSAATGGALLPTPTSGTLIDRLRNAAQVMKAGATTVVMTEPTLYMGRLTSGPTPALAWHSEGQQINSSDRSVDKITFEAKTLPSLLLISYELLNDMSDEAAQVIENDIVLSMALEVDRACLRGAGTSVEPSGIRNQGVTLTSLGANGAIPLWDNIVDGVATLRKANVEADGIIWSARTQQGFDKMKQSTGAYLEPPPGIAEIPRLVSNQVPDNLTQGQSNAASEIYIGNWANLLLGLRQDIGFQIMGEDTGPSMGRVMVLRERWADQGLAGLLCFWRGDVQVGHLQAFNVLTGVTTS